MRSNANAAPNRRATIANLGCKVNRAEMDVVERLLRARGLDLVDTGQAAEIVVVNTCTVTSIADRKSRQAIRRARRANPDARLLVTGCSVSVDPSGMAAVDPGARMFDTASKGGLLAELANLLDIPSGADLPSISGVERVDEPGEVGRAGVPVGVRSLEGGTGEVSGEDAFEPEIDRTRAFVKIQDGCSFHCTYCIIPRARGPERSVPADEVLADVRRALAAGHREVVLTGINAGTWADERDPGPRGSGERQGLPVLVRRILAETDVERIRLSSVEPQHVTDDLLDTWAGSAGRCLPHFHVPLQSGDDTILRRMGRRYDTAFYAALVARIRRAVPGVAVHADLIVGFPGEDEASWGRTVAYLRALDLAGLHVFRYSARPGTAAARMIGQVDARTRKRRAAEALALAGRARAAFAARQLGAELRVLFERQMTDGRWLGHAENHVPVVAAAPDGEPLGNAICLVGAESIDSRAPDRLAGRLIRVDRRGPTTGRRRNLWRSRLSRSKIGA